MKFVLRTFGVLTLACACLSGVPGAAQQAAQPAKAPGVLTRTDAGPIMPPTVFFAGQSASIQARNSAGVRTPSGKLVLAALVDTSGYSSGVAQNYQAYLITEVPLTFGSQKLSPGAYGFGFLPGDHMIVMDLGGNKLFETQTIRDAALPRPTPLQIIGKGPAFRLYLGRNFATFEPASR